VINNSFVFANELCSGAAFTELCVENGIR